MGRVLRLLGRLAVATASCALALWAARFLVLESVPTLASVVSGVELHRFRGGWLFPRSLMRFPSDVSPVLYALCQGGFLLSGAAVVVLGLVCLRRAQGWLRLLLTQTILWAGLLVALTTGFYAGWARGPLAAAGRALWPTQAGSLSLRIPLGLAVALLVLFASFLALRSFLDSAADTRNGRALALAGWLLLPSAGVSLALATAFFPPRGLWQVGLTSGPALFILLAGLPAALAAPTPAPPWRPGGRGGVALLAAVALAAASLLGWDELVRMDRRGDFVELGTKYWRLHFEKAALAQTEPTAAATAADDRLLGIAQRLGLKPPNPLLHAYLYASTETKTAWTESDEPFSLGPDSVSVHHLLAPGGGLSDPRGDARLLMQSAWGRPGSAEVAEALARYAVGDFHGYSLADYAGRITREEQRYSLREVFSLDDEYLSPLVCDALRGAWVESLVERRGQEVLSTLYREPLAPGREEVFARALGSAWDALEEDWRHYLLGVAVRPEALGPAPARTLTQPTFQRGISFSHEWGENWGYGSDRALKELERIRALGANAVAVVPYAFTRAPRDLRIHFATDESDDRVIRTLAAARRLGLSMMLKPQLWGSGFTGDIAFANDAAFERWFAAYHRWLLHMARLAELEQVDVLVIGTELSALSSRQAAWRALIADIRRIYTGRLTYAAHFGAEFESLPFWDALDYLGVNMYYPLAAPGEAPRPDSPRVRALVEKLTALAKQHGKPVLFTEVGYPSLASAAAEPWAEGGDALDLEMQRRCYETVFAAFSDQPWLAGLYWWKWPTHGSGTRFDASFNPIGKPAAEVIKRCYSRPGVLEGLPGHPIGGIVIEEDRRPR